MHCTSIHDNHVTNRKLNKVAMNNNEFINYSRKILNHVLVLTNALELQRLYSFSLLSCTKRLFNGCNGLALESDSS